MQKLYQLLLISILLSALTACGGGGASSKHSTANQNPNANGRVSLAWSPPSTRSDGSFLPINELAGYKVYMGTSRSNLSQLVDLNDEAINNYTVSNLPAGSYYFAVSAYDMDGFESGFSQVIRRSAEQTLPSG